jgi:outer membrane lipoprotein-sorting protein/peroxiredoxin
MMAAITCGGLARTPARADEKADALLAKAKAAYKSAKSLSATLTASTLQGTQKFEQSATVQLRKPNFARIKITSPQKASIMSDGKNVYILMADNQYMKQPVEQGLGQVETMGGLPVALFLGHDSYGLGTAKLSDADVQTKYSGKETVAGASYDVLTISGKSPFVHTVKVYIGADGLIGRTVSEISVQNTKGAETSELKDQKLNAVPATTSFAVALPKDAKLFTPPTDADYAAKLVAVGKPAPVFALPTPTGGTVSLTDSAADHKAVLVNFWFYGWGACREEFPHLQQLFSELKDKGLDLIAVNNGDSKDTINKYVAENKFTFKIGMPPQGYGIFNDYGVQAYPTNYVVDSKGKVVFRCVGFDEEGIKKALADLGVK